MGNDKVKELQKFSFNYLKTQTKDQLIIIRNKILNVTYPTNGMNEVLLDIKDLLKIMS